MHKLQDELSQMEDFESFLAENTGSHLDGNRYH